MEQKTSTVTLRPMTEAEYAQWLPRQTEQYAASKVRAGNWAEAVAVDLAARQMAELLPQGVKTPGHKIWTLIAPGQTSPVGALWVNIKQSPGESSRGPYAYIYDIEVSAEQRGNGYGTAALAALEQTMKKDGITALLLHVFGYNTGARRLYERFGFEVTNINMAKSLR